MMSSLAMLRPGLGSENGRSAPKQTSMEQPQQNPHSKTPFDGFDGFDGFLQVTDQEARHTARRLASEEGIFGGFSAGANVAAALQLIGANGPCRGETVAVMVCDSGLKYLSTDLWDDKD